MANATRIGRTTTAASSPLDRPLLLDPLFCVSDPDPEPEPPPLPSPSLPPPEPSPFEPPPEVESGSPLDDPPLVLPGEAEFIVLVAPCELSVADVPEPVPAVPCELEAEPVAEALPPVDA